VQPVQLIKIGLGTPAKSFLEVIEQKTASFLSVGSWTVVSLA